MEWFYADESDRQHKVEEAELADFVERKIIRPDTLVWNETMSDWQPCRDVRPDLFGGEQLPPAITVQQRREITKTSPGDPHYQSPTDAVAVCALVFGIIGLVCIQIFSVVAVICGHIALKRAQDTSGTSPNKGLAIAGLVMGYLGIIVFVLIILFYGAAILAAIASEGFSS
jgi:hypothetical protein